MFPNQITAETENLLPQNPGESDVVPFIQTTAQDPPLTTHHTPITGSPNGKNYFLSLQVHLLQPRFLRDAHDDASPG